MKKVIIPLVIASILPVASLGVHAEIMCTMEYSPVCGIEPGTGKQKIYGNKCAMNAVGAKSCEESFNSVFDWAKKLELTTVENIQTFRPNAIITREEAAVIIERAFSKNLFKNRPITLMMYVPLDNDKIAPEFSSAINFVYNARIMRGDNGKFSPKNPLTHLEAMAIILRSLDENEEYASKTHPWYRELVREFNETISTETSSQFLNSPISRKNFFTWIMTFANKNPTISPENVALNGTWNLELFQAKDMPVVKVHGTMTLGDNRVHAKFCNNINGELRYEDEKIFTKGLASTRMFCGDENLMNAEMAFDLNEAEYDLEKAGTELVITTKKGDIYVFSR